MVARLTAGLHFSNIFRSYSMKLLFAQAILWAAYVFGLCLGLSFCVAVGAALGSVLSHAPLTGGAVLKLIWF